MLSGAEGRGHRHRIRRLDEPPRVRLFENLRSEFGMQRVSRAVREEMADDEWRSFIAWCVEFFNANLRDFGTEKGCVSYIRFQMRYLLAGLGLARSTAGVWRDVIDESEIPKVIAWFVSLPDAADYGYKP